VRQRRITTAVGGVLFILLLILAANKAQVSAGALMDGLPRIGDYFAKTTPALSPGNLFADTKTEGSLAYWFYRIDLWGKLLWETAQMAFLATLIGAFVALFASFPASRNLVARSWIYHLSRRILELFRTVPDIVYALILVWAFGVGPLAGVLAMALHSIGALGKLFAEVNENVDHKPLDGLRACGGTWPHVMRYGVAPQVMPSVLSYTLLRFEINVRAASVIGFVGAGGIGQELYTVIAQNIYEEVSAIVLLIILTVFAIDMVSERLRLRLIEGERLVAATAEGTGH